MNIYTPEAIGERLREISERIAAACERSGRELGEVRIVAVTKTHPIEAIVAAWNAGLREFGENRVQEAAKKFPLVPTLLPHAREHGCKFHLIGHLQTNKAKQAVALFDLIHSVDSTKLADELEKYAARLEHGVPVLVQVNVSGEETKSGISPENTAGLVAHLLEHCPHLTVEGYMTMAPFLENPEETRPYFRQLREIRDRMGREFAGAKNYRGKELSMGMTNDYVVAVEEGATIVRIGTALFGSR